MALVPRSAVRARSAERVSRYNWGDDLGDQQADAGKPATEGRRRVPESTSSSPPQSSAGTGARSYLRDLQPADGGYKAPHPTTLGQKQYYDSIGMYCTGNTTRIVWAVPLGSRELVAVLGIDSAAGGSAIGGTARIQFRDESGIPLRPSAEAAIGRPASISVPVQGKAQMQVLCTAHNPQTEGKGYTPYFDIELADAAFVL